MISWCSGLSRQKNNTHEVVSSILVVRKNFQHVRKMPQPPEVVQVSPGGSILGPLRLGQLNSVEAV